MPEKYEIDLDAVSEIVNRHGIACYVEQTGGGVATVYAGGTWHWDEDDTDRYKAVAGPGWFEGPNYTQGRASLYDFVIGPDTDGEAGVTTPVNIGAYTEQDVAKLIVAQARKDDPTVCLSFDDVEALGFDGTERSMPPDMVAENKRTDVSMAARNAENKRLADAGVPYNEHRRTLTDLAGMRALAEYDARQAGVVLPAENPQTLQVRGVTVEIFESTTTPGVAIQIDTQEAEPGQRVRVMLNDGDLFIGDPEHDDHPWSRQVQDYYDQQNKS